MNIYEIRRRGTIAFVLLSIVVVAGFLYVSGTLVADLSEQERERMQIWADATKEIVNIGTEDSVGGGEPDIEFLLSIIEGNRNIPVLLTDDEGTIIMHRNFNLPEPIDSLNPLYISEVNGEYLRKKLEKLQGTPNVIHIIIAPGNMQHLYYEDSRLLRNLSLYPYVQLLVMLVFIAIVYFAVQSTLRAEQNKVWVGLSKETAHQLGTPISSLMAWVEYLESAEYDPDVVSEISKDVNRLSTIASRFSKVGSKPNIEPADLNAVVTQSVDYMATRISRRIRLTLEAEPQGLPVKICEPLLQWVMENLIKNAVDAMDGEGSITVATHLDAKRQMAVVDVADTGKGLSRKQFKTIFRPGYTTKKRGWGLGLTLAKRIVEEYHAGRIFVKQSEPGVGTTFRIEIPLDNQTTNH